LRLNKGSCVFATSEFPSEIPRTQTRNYSYTRPLQHIVKLTSEYIKNNYLILIFKLIILSLFITLLVIGFHKINDYYYAVGDYNNNRLSEYLKISINESFLIPALLVLMPLIGIFINKKIGWILFQSFFYFLITNLVFTADLTDKTLILMYVIGFSLLLLILLLMNKKKISSLKYGIAKNELIGSNIIASVIGISITMMITMIKGNVI